jgi:hypothetical protein
MYVINISLFHKPSAKEIAEKKTIIMIMKIKNTFQYY